MTRRSRFERVPHDKLAKALGVKPDDIRKAEETLGALYRQLASLPAVPRRKRKADLAPPP